MRSDRDVAVKTLVAAYKDVLRRLREARAERDTLTDVIFGHFQEWMREGRKGKPRRIYGLIHEFYEEMGIEDPNVKKGLSNRLHTRYLRWREQHE